MKKRRLLDGTVVQDLPEAKTLKVYTRCPQKYILIDTETGQEYRGNPSEDGMDWIKSKSRLDDWK